MTTTHLARCFVLGILAAVVLDRSRELATWIVVPIARVVGLEGMP